MKDHDGHPLAGFGGLHSDDTSEWRGQQTEHPTPEQAMAEHEAERKRWTGDAFMMGFLIAMAKDEPDKPLHNALLIARSRARAKGYNVPAMNLSDAVNIVLPKLGIGDE